MNILKNLHIRMPGVTDGAIYTVNPACGLTALFFCQTRLVNMGEASVVYVQ